MTTLAGLILTSPSMLWAMVLVVLPIIAHWLRRRNIETFVFPSVTLIRSSSVGRIRLFRLRNWLLLMCRVGVVGLICLVFAEPKWVNPSSGSKNLPGRHVVMILDVSASAQQSRHGVTAWQTIRAGMDDFIDGLRPGLDNISIIVADAHAKLIPAAPNDPDQLRDILDRLHPKSAHADAMSAVNLALDVVNKTKGRAEIVLACDMQAENWSEAAELLTRESVARHIRVTVIRPTFESPDNLAVHDPRIDPCPPLLNEPVTFRADVTNHALTRKRVNVRVMVDELIIANRTLDLEGGKSTEVSFSARFDEPGTHRVTFLLPEDGLSLDNQAYLAVNIHKRPVVGLMTDENTHDVIGAAYYLARVLQPFRDNRDRWNLVRINQENLNEAMTKPLSALFLYRAEFDSRQINALIHFMEQGGTIIWLADPDTTARQMSRLSQFMPETPMWIPTEFQDRNNDNALTIVDIDLGSNVFSGITETERRAYTRHLFKSAWIGQTTPLPSNVRSLMTYNSGQPALIAQRIGAGVLYLWNLSIEPGINTFHKSGGFVALIHRLTELATRVRAMNYKPASHGHDFQPLHHPPAPHGSALRAVGPDPDATVMSLAYLDMGLPAVSVSAGTPGFYNVLQGDTRLGTVAMNVDPRESYLTRFDASSFEITHAQDTDTIHKDVSKTNVNTVPLWPWVIGVAALLLMIESILSLRT